MNITLTGTTGITVPSTVPSGAVNIIATHTGKAAPGAFGLVRLNQSVPPSQAIAAGFGAIAASHGNLDALTATGNALVVAANATGPVQTVLSPGHWLALNISGNGMPATMQFTVTQSSSPAALPRARSTESAIEFGFRGSRVLHNNTVVRARNKGYLVHMIDLVGLKSKAVWPTVRRLLRAGAPQRAFRPFLNGHFVSLLDPASPGALQQITLHTKRGWYAEVCFMDTQDGREHSQLGMERLVHVKS
jgi:hypothetical protein